MNEKIRSYLRTLLLCVCLLPLGVTAKDEKKLYLSKLNIRDGVPSSIKDTIINRIKLTVIERYGDRYRIVSDSDVALMNKKAENLMKQGCDAEACMRQIADAIDADEIFYGDVVPDGDKVRFAFTNILRDSVTLVMSTKSVAEVSFPESQYDHFVREAVTKLIDPKYKINMNVTIKADDTISVKTINLGKVDGLDLSVLDFKSNDSVISDMLDVLREDIKKGDNYFTNKDYGRAREKYKEVFDKVQTKVSKEKREKIKSFEESVVDRIGSTYVMYIKEEMIESVDTRLTQIKNATDSQLKEIIEKYTSAEREMDKVPQEYQKRLANLRKGVDDRKESVELALVSLVEARGDTHYRENRFEEAIKTYSEGRVYTEWLREPKKKEAEEKLAKKIETSKKTGENFTRNSIRTYLDQAEFLNLQGRLNEARQSLGLARKIIEESPLTPDICSQWYAETAGLLGVGGTVKSAKQKVREEEEARLEEERQRKLRKDCVDGGGEWTGSRCKSASEIREEKLAEKKRNCEKQNGEWTGESCEEPIITSEWFGFVKLVWDPKSNKTRINWYDAKKYCEDRGKRLPTLEELKTHWKALKDSGWHWSSTDYDNHSLRAYLVHLGTGVVHYGYDKAYIDSYVRCVR